MPVQIKFYPSKGLVDGCLAEGLPGVWQFNKCTGGNVPQRERVYCYFYVQGAYVLSWKLYRVVIRFNEHIDPRSIT